MLRPTSQIGHPKIVTNIGLSPISTGHQQCLTMKTRSKRALSDDIEIPFVRMLMVFQNADPEPIIMQIAEKMIAKRLKNNFNDSFRYHYRSYYRPYYDCNNQFLQGTPQILWSWSGLLRSIWSMNFWFNQKKVNENEYSKKRSKRQKYTKNYFAESEAEEACYDDIEREEREASDVEEIVRDSDGSVSCPSLESIDNNDDKWSAFESGDDFQRRISD